MNKVEAWYSLEKNNRMWTIWYNKETKNGYGSFGIYSSRRKKECIEYCKKNKIKIEK